jgi:hypothetical protein
VRNIKFHENPSGEKSADTCGQTDGRTDEANTHFPQFMPTQLKRLTNINKDNGQIKRITNLQRLIGKLLQTDLFYKTRNTGI